MDIRIYQPLFNDCFLFFWSLSLECFLGSYRCRCLHPGNHAQPERTADRDQRDHRDQLPKYHGSWNHGLFVLEENEVFYFNFETGESVVTSDI